MGRRWSHTILLFLNTIFLLINALVANDPSLATVVTVFCLLAKFNCTATFIIVYIQSIELFPTCVRNTGMGLTLCISMIIGIGGPYVVYLGSVDTRLPYAILAILCFLGTIAASLLPETVGVDLPESLSEAEAFGKDQKFFSWIRKADKTLEQAKNDEKQQDTEEAEPLRQPS
jgi:OCT family organic cation transporter-like MFS transporter 4/5